MSRVLRDTGNREAGTVLRGINARSFTLLYRVSVSESTVEGGISPGRRETSAILGF